MILSFYRGRSGVAKDIQAISKGVPYILARSELENSHRLVIINGMR